jgi:hypothetical protein
MSTDLPQLADLRFIEIQVDLFFGAPIGPSKGLGNGGIDHRRLEILVIRDVDSASARGPHDSTDGTRDEGLVARL